MTIVKVGPSEGARHVSEAAYVGRGVHRTAVESLARKVFDGTYDEGDTLELPALLAELGVSQTVLREAVKVLTAKGLLDARQKRGTFVRPRADWNLLDSDVLRWKLAAGAPHDFFADVLELRRAIEPPPPPRRRAPYGRGSGCPGRRARRHAGGRERSGARRAGRHLVPHRAPERLAQPVLHPVAPGDRARARGAGPHGRADGHEDPVPAHAAVVRSVRDGDVDGAYMAVLELLDLSLRDHP